MHNRIIVTVVFLLSILHFLPASGIRQTADESTLPGEVVIGFQNLPNGEIIAKDLGWHEESFGIPVRWIQIDSGRDLNTAIAAGSIDLGLGGSSTTVAGIVQGVPAKVFWIYDIIGDNEALVVRSDSGISSPRELIGKTVAAPFGATTHYHLLAALTLWDVDPGKVRIVDMQPPDMLAAWLRGDIDAGFVWEPTLAKMLDSGGKVLVASGEIAAKGYLTGDIGFVRREFAEKYPHLVVAYLENQIRAVELYREDPAAAAASVSRQFGISHEEAARQMASLVLLDGREQLASEYFGTGSEPGALAGVFKDTADFLHSQGLIRVSPPVETFVDSIDSSFLRLAVENLERE